MPFCGVKVFLFLSILSAKEGSLIIKGREDAFSLAKKKSFSQIQSLLQCQKHRILTPNMAGWGGGWAVNPITANAHSSTCWPTAAPSQHLRCSRHWTLDKTIQKPSGHYPWSLRSSGMFLLLGNDLGVSPEVH